MNRQNLHSKTGTNYDVTQSDMEKNGSKNSVTELDTSGPELDNSGPDLDVFGESRSNEVWWGPDNSHDEMLQYYENEREMNSEDYNMTQEEHF